jgi:very-short-patch-repair endonuclease
VIEADGPLHDPVHDAARDAWLETQGFRVLRFSNGQISNRDWEVVDEILRATNAPPADPNT